MGTPSFFLRYEDHSEQTFEEFTKKLFDADRKTLADVTIRDLCAMREHPNGLYFAFAGPELQYVGKCTSRSFIERIPAHFDPRLGAWFNTIPKKFMQHGRSYPEALDAALGFQLVMLGIDDPGKLVTFDLETLCRSELAPALNPAKKKLFDTTKTLAQLRDWMLQNRKLRFRANQPSSTDREEQ